MNVLVIGGGGREHALCWALKRSPKLDQLFCAPGNAGIASLATCITLDTADHQAVIAFCQLNAIGLVVVGPEVPLVAGIADDLTAAGIATFGPSKAAAELEGSKAFTKALCREAGIPTAAYHHCQSQSKAEAVIAERTAFPVVIKADGLAAGKGVTIAEDAAAANAAIAACFDGTFGAAGEGAEVVIEDYLEGDEASLFVLADGTTAKVIGTAQDHKRAFDDDKGPNTGGMGAYAPAPVLTPRLLDAAMTTIVEPTLAAMAKRGTPYTGVLYAGLMITAEGPKLIEYNVRFGDPECQVIMPRLKSDLLEILSATAEGRLAPINLEFFDDTALTVVLAAEGYPGPVEKGREIKNVEAADTIDGIVIFHAGTKATPDGRLLANGGRVLNVTAIAPTITQARNKAYAAVDVIDWPESHHRRDIGWRALAIAD